MKIFLFLTLFIAATYSSNAARITSVSNGDWLNKSTWDLNRIPKNGDTIMVKTDVQINGSTITLNDVQIMVRKAGSIEFKWLIVYPTLNLTGNSDLKMKEGGEIYGDSYNGFLLKVGGIVKIDNSIEYSTLEDHLEGPWDLGKGVTLPIKLISFNAEKQGNSVVLEWATASEKNNDYFELQRGNSTDNFETIATIDGNGTTNELINYSFEDKNPLNGANYYQLKQVDYDGKFTYSPIVFVEVEKTITEISFFPNPFNSELMLNAYNTNEFTDLVIFDGRGNVVVSQTLTLDASGVTSLTEFVDQLNMGKYFVHITINGSTERHQIIKD